MNRFMRLVAVLALALSAAASFAQTAAYPDRPVKLVVPFPPGGTADIVARFLAQRLTSELGQSFYIENRTGAGGLIGANFVAKAPPDGYTLLMSGSGPLGVGLATFRSVPYDVIKDFAPVSIVAEAQMVVVSNPKFAPKSLPDIVTYAKAHPMAVRNAVNALGSMHHLMMAKFALDIGTSFTMVPYRGSGPAILDTLAGLVDLDVENLPAVTEYISAGKLRAIATMGAERAPQLPNIPTFKELGYSDIVAAPWFGMVAPAKTSAAIVEKLNRAITAILEKPDAKAALEKVGAYPTPSSVQAATEKIKSETTRWAEIVKKTGVRSE